MRKHPECGVIITGDFNQLRDNFMKTHYRFVQVVNVVTHIRQNMDEYGGGIHPTCYYLRTGVIGP